MPKRKNNPFRKNTASRLFITDQSTSDQSETKLTPEAEYKPMIPDIQTKLKIKRFLAYGSVIIFLSWATQNVLKDYQHNAVDKIEKSLNELEVIETNYNMYAVALENARTKDTVTNQVLHNKLMGYLYMGFDYYGSKLMSSAEAVAFSDKKEYNNNEEKQRKFVSQLQGYYKNHHLDSLRLYSIAISSEVDKHSTEVIRSYRHRLEHEQGNETWFNWMFIILYVGGVSFYAKAWIIDYRIIKKELLERS